MRVQISRKYDAEFKRQAVQWSIEEGRTVAGGLVGIHKDLIYQWRKQLKKKENWLFPVMANSF